MKPIIKTTNLKNVLLFQHEVFEDHRGSYEELYNRKDYTEAIQEATGEVLTFLEDDIAVSERGVLRGLHGDDRTWKLVTCLKGRYFINVLNYDKGSDQFGQYQSFVLSDSNKYQLLIPPNHGHGYIVLSDIAIFHYKQTCNYKGMENQFTIKYNDPQFNMWWPVSDPILSRRDSDVLQG